MTIQPTETLQPTDRGQWRYESFRDDFISPQPCYEIVRGVYGQPQYEIAAMTYTLEWAQRLVHTLNSQMGGF